MNFPTLQYLLPNLLFTKKYQWNLKIDLDGFKADQYELLYIEKAVTFIGEFEIE